MKNIFTISLLLLVSHLCHSQLNVVKEYDANEYICSYNSFEGVDLYATYNSGNNKITIYDTDHNLVHNMVYQSTEHLSNIYIYGLSRDVFNTDNKIELLIQSINSKGEMIFELINEENERIQSFKSAMIRTIGSKNYIVESTVDTRKDLDSDQISFHKSDKLFLIEGKFRRLIN